MNTLNELAAALSNDAIYLTTVQHQFASKAPLASPTFTGTVSGTTNFMVGLGNVDNTADANKPISSATQDALSAKQNAITSTSTITASSFVKAGGSNTYYLVAKRFYFFF